MQSYKDTKSMVLDILRTEEGQKALLEAQNSNTGSTLQMLGTNQEHIMRTTVKDVMTDPSFYKQMEKIMTDPKFAGEFAKTIAKENKAILKELMKDPEYQTMLIQVMKNPEAEKLILEVMKGTVYRKQAMAIFQDSLNNPLFRVELMELMKKAIEEETRPKEEELAAQEEE